MATETLRWRNDEFKTDLTDAQAAEIMARVPQNHASYSYASSLLADFRRYGNLFTGKRYWFHVLASEQLSREQPTEPIIPDGTPSNAVGFLPNIAAFLTPVSKRLKSGARVSFESGLLTVRISRASERSRWPGSFYVQGLTGFGEDGNSAIYAGRISPEGHWFPSRECEVAVNALLDEFEQNPAEYAAAYGRRTGRCCFCRLKLTDVVSIGLGYGSICAGHYNLPHGVKVLAAAVAKRYQPAAEEVA